MLIISCLCIGFDTEGLPSAVWPGGETEALTRIERHLERKVQEHRLGRMGSLDLSSRITFEI